MRKAELCGAPDAKAVVPQRQAAEDEKMRALCRLSAGIASEFSNILTIMLGYVDLTMQSEEISSPALENLDVVRAAAVRGADLVKSLSVFARCDIGQKEAVSLSSVVDQALGLAKKDLEGAGVKLVVRHSTNAPLVDGNAAQLLEVVTNLISNAKHAMAKSTVKTLTVQTGVNDGNPFVRIADTGCGIPEVDLSRIFEPFYTTKGALGCGEIYDGKTHGTGLGLSICHSIVSAHGGTINVTSEVGEGTSFTVCLPAMDDHKSEGAG